MSHVDAMKKACRELSHVGYRLWTAINSWQNDTSFELSQVAMEKEWGITRSSYYNAIADLEKHHYLEKLRDGSNIYVFNEDGV